MPLLRPVPAGLPHGILLQQPVGDSARGRADRPIHAGQRRRRQPRAHESRRQGGRRVLHRPLDHAHREARARVVVLAAGALESTRILLNSRSPRFRTASAIEEGVLGHYLMDHFTVEGAGGFMPPALSPPANRWHDPAASSFPSTRTCAPARIPASSRLPLRRRRQPGAVRSRVPSQGFGDAWRQKVRARFRTTSRCIAG